MKKVINYWTYLFSITAFLTCFGCGQQPKPEPDPLAAWAIEYLQQPSEAVEKDYKQYISQLSPEERNATFTGPYYKDNKGNHAIKIVVAIKGTNWGHVLIYDNKDKRIKVIKYLAGHYSC